MCVVDSMYLVLLWHKKNVRHILQVRNLRSQVSRVAMMALAEMFVTLKRNMDIVSIYIHIYIYLQQVIVFAQY